MILMSLTHQVEVLLLAILNPVVAAVAPAALAPALPAAPRATLTLLATPKISLPHPSHSPATTLMPLMKHGHIFIIHIPSPCATSGASCVQSSAPVFSSLMRLLSVAN